MSSWDSILIKRLSNGFVVETGLDDEWYVPDKQAIMERVARLLAGEPAEDDPPEQSPPILDPQEFLKQRRTLKRLEASLHEPSQLAPYVCALLDPLWSLGELTRRGGKVLAGGTERTRMFGEIGVQLFSMYLAVLHWVREEGWSPEAYGLPKHSNLARYAWQKSFKQPLESLRKRARRNAEASARRQERREHQDEAGSMR